MNPQEQKIKQLKLKSKIIVQRLSHFGQPLQQFVNFFYSFTQVGNNFIGKLDAQRIIGIALYFQQKKDYHNILFGELIDGKLKEKGLLIKIYKNIQKESNPQKLQVDAIFLKRWIIKDREGVYYSKDSESNQTYFRGSFNQDFSFRKGKVQIRRSESLVKQYQGQFLNNQFHGEGQLLIAGQYKYKGGFQRNQRNGFGVQEDFSRNSIYIGNFQINKKEGYGELSYFMGQKVIKLKGFWKNGTMENQQGVFINQKGEQIGLFDRNFTRFF